MSHHFRSQSEHYQPVAGAQPQQPVESFIRVHTDSQQSLDRLFNPPASAVPLRSRNLPRSFFDPSLRPKEDDSNSAASKTNGISSHQSFHARSVSYGQQPEPRTGRTFHSNNFHQRTQSILVPMPDIDSGQSSLECLATSTTPTAAVATATTQPIANYNNNHNNNSNNNNNQHQQNPQPMSPVDGSHVQYISQQPPPPQQHGTSAEWVSPTTSMENLNGLSGGSIERLHPSHAPQHAMVLQQPAASLAPLQQPPQHVMPSFYQPPTTSAVAPPNAGYMNNNNNNNLHSRSMSFDQQHHLHHQHQRPMAAGRGLHQNNFHTRTHSTIVPMPASTVVTSSGGPPLPYTQTTSSEFLNYGSSSNNNSINQSATGWSSSGYSSDDMTGAAATHNNGTNGFWPPNHQTQHRNNHHHHHLHHQQSQVLPAEHVGPLLTPLGAHHGQPPPPPHHTLQEIGAVEGLQPPPITMTYQDTI